MSDDVAITWTVARGIVTEIKYKGDVWVKKTCNKKPILMKPHKRGMKNKLVVWLNSKKIGDVFTLDEFYNETSTARSSNHRYERIATDLIKTDNIRQVDKHTLRLIERIEE